MIGDRHSRGFDPEEVLRAYRPRHAATEYLVPGADPDADALLARLLVAEPKQLRRIRPTRTVVAAAVATALLGGVAAAWIISREPADKTVIACYSDASIATADQIALPPDPRRDPIDQCGALWSDGTFATTGPPELAACVTDADILAVIPGDQAVCAAAGWQTADTSPPGTSVDRSTELVTALSDAFVDSCLDPVAATATVRSVLDELALADWTITDSTSGEGCTAPLVDGATRTIRLIAVPT